MENIEGKSWKIEEKIQEFFEENFSLWSRQPVIVWLHKLRHNWIKWEQFLNYVIFFWKVLFLLQKRFKYNNILTFQQPSQYFSTSPVIQMSLQAFRLLF
jgi:hypothetical protein